MKYLYEANRDFQTTRQWCHESEYEIKQHLELIFTKKRTQHQHQRSKRTLAITFFGLGLFLLGIPVFVVAYLLSSTSWQFSENAIYAFVCASPGLIGIGASILTLIQPLEVYVDEEAHYDYVGLEGAPILSGQIVYIDVLSPTTRRIGYTAFDSFLIRQTPHSFLTDSPIELAIEDTVAVLISRDISVLL